eukprot:3067128-Rhodomonas_salina.2
MRSCVCWRFLTEGRVQMFCAQCSQHDKSCTTTVGNCRKTPQVSKQQDIIIQIAKEVGYYAHAARALGKEIPDHINRFTLFSIFSTLTNVNNDSARFQVQTPSIAQTTERSTRCHRNALSSVSHFAMSETAGYARATTCPVPT